MTGVEILSEYAVTSSPVWVAFVIVLGIIGAVIFAAVFATAEDNKTMTIGGICMCICVVTCLTFGIIEGWTDWLEKYDHTEYKVTIDDSVSMKDFLDKYEIIDQEGKIYTVKERE